MSVEVGRNVLEVNCRGALRDCVGYFFGFLFCLVLTLAMLFANDVNPDARGVGAAIFGIAALIIGYLLWKQYRGERVVFDPAAKTVTFSPIFGRRKETLRFDEVVRIAPMTNKSLLFTRHGYCLVSQGKPIFGNRRISTFWGQNSSALEEFRRRTVPAIESMIGLQSERTSTPPEAADMSRAGYVKEGSLYVKSFTKRLAAQAAIAVVLLLLGGSMLGSIYEDEVGFGFLLALGSLIWLFVILFGPVKSVAIDTSRKSITVRRGLLPFRKKSYSFDSVTGFEVLSFHGNWATNATRHLSIKFAGVKKPLRLSAGRVKLSEKMNQELFGLAALVGFDPLPKIDYRQKRVGGGILDIL